MFEQVGLYDGVWSLIILCAAVWSASGTYPLASVLGTLPRTLTRGITTGAVT